MRIPILLLSIISWAIINVGQPATSPQQDFPDVCQESGNILPNCDFNNGLDGWVQYFEQGGASVEVQQGGGECHAPLCPAVHIVTEGHFVGGIYQQVPVTAGNTYYANIVWLAFDSLNNDAGINAAVGGIGRRIGIDPFGGTDSTSANVVWSEDNWRNDCKICNVEYVTVTAQADKITVFIRIDDTWRPRAAEKGYAVPASKDQFWLDDIGLKQVAGSEAPSPTDTPPPPSDTPVPEPLPDTSEAELPTDTPSPLEPTVEPTEAEIAQLNSAEVVQPVSPLPTPVPDETITPATDGTIAPPPTLTPSATPSPSPTPGERTPTPTRHPHASASAASESSILSAGFLSTIGTTACLGGLVLLIMAAVIAGAAWLYRLGWGQTQDEDDFDEVEEIIVNIDE